MNATLFYIYRAGYEIYSEVVIQQWLRLVFWTNSSKLQSAIKMVMLRTQLSIPRAKDYTYVYFCMVFSTVLHGVKLQAYRPCSLYAMLE